MNYIHMKKINQWNIVVIERICTQMMKGGVVGFSWEVMMLIIIIVWVVLVEINRWLVGYG